MTEVSHRDLRELADKLGEMSSAVSRIEEKISGTDTILSLHLENINNTLTQSRDERDAIRERILAMETQVARLIGKWSIVMILIAGIVSATVASMVTDDGVEFPIGLVPKTEIPIVMTVKPSPPTGRI